MLMNALKELLKTSDSPDLGPGPRAGCLDVGALDAKVKTACPSSRISETNHRLIRATIYLWHDHLDASHTISQSIENADGSYLHAIMHRREPDYWNSKYWFRRVGSHACFSSLAAEVAKLLEVQGEQKLASKLLPKGQWDPNVFVDECERVDSLPGNDQRVQTLREIQALEFRLLLDYLVG